MSVRLDNLRSVAGIRQMLSMRMEMHGTFLLLLVQRVAYENSELDPSALELLSASPVIVAASVYKYWIQSWEKAAEEPSISDLLKLAEMNLIRGLVLTKEVYSILEDFDGKFAKEEVNLKKLSEDLETMSLEKAQLESEKRFFQVHLDSLVAKEGDLKAKYKVELKVVRECLKDARDRRKATEAFQKPAEEAQKLAEERAFAAETAMATANSILEAMIVEKDKLLAEVKEEIERVNADRVDAKARVVAVYQDGFEATSAYKNLVYYFMTAGGEQLIERIAETHPEWDILFLRDFPGEITTSVELQDVGEAQILAPTTREGPQCTDPSEAAGQ
ncbi:hypothetical protein Adt_02324 [Abeliophyllum distichum]|uniref:Uncharacterized protein n=1 Tax=Abeliophyllum distichum TaxID=126358 RepID=A0ABD1VVH0_9LAMI